MFREMSTDKRGPVAGRPGRAILAIAALVTIAGAGIEPVAADETGVASKAVQAAEAKVPADGEPWRFNAALYGWMINISGNTTIRNQTVDTNASFFQLLQQSDSLIGFMGYFEANKGQAGFYTDLVFAKLGFSAQQLNYRNPLPGVKLSLTTQAALTYEMFIAEVGGVFELDRWPGSEGSLTALDALGGFRYWNMSTEVSLDAQLGVNVERLHFDRSFGLAVARSGTVQWVDPVVGLRLRHQFTPNQQIFVRGDIGGFGLGSSFTWQAVGAYSYAWQANGYQVAALIGFRALGVNYSQGSGADTFALNETLFGPIIGVSFRW